MPIRLSFAIFLQLSFAVGEAVGQGVPLPPKLSGAEQKLVLQAAFAQGLTYEIQKIYPRKPIPTLRLLVMIVEIGRPYDAIDAYALIGSLVESPENGVALRKKCPVDTLDDVIDGASETERDRIYADSLRMFRKIDKRGPDIDFALKPFGIEKLSPAEDKLLRTAVYSHSPAIGTDYRDFKEPPRRLLAIPNDVSTIYSKKPLATLHVLLKIAEAGRRGDARHAIILIGGLVEGPHYGAIGVYATPDLLDNVFEGSADSHRQRLCAECESAIRAAEKRFAEKEKK